MSDAIEEVITRSQSILDLQDDWDGEGSPGYSRETWERAIAFLRRLVKMADIPAPVISPAERGSIDLYWSTDDSSLLINFSPDDTFDAYFGRNIQRSIIGPNATADMRVISTFLK